MATKTRTELWGSANFGGGNRRWRRSRMLEKPQVSGRGAVSCWHRIPAFSLSRGWGKKQEEGEKRKQEKGTVSRQVPSGCLHIVFHGDMPSAPPKNLDRKGENPPLPARIVGA